MPAGLPCPNPTCTQVFPPEALKAGTLKCPRCGGVFDFRGKTAPPAAPPRPAPVSRPAPAPKAPPHAPARPAPKPAAPPAPPVAIPVAAVPVPMAVPVASAPNAPAPSSNLDFATNPQLTISTPRTPPRKGRDPWPILLIVLLLVAGAGGILFLIYRPKFSGGDAESTKVPARLQEFNCDMKPPLGWKHDRGMESDMDVLYAMRRKDLNTYFALEATDFKERFPNKSFLIETFKKRLGRLFEDLAWQPKPPASIDKLDKLGTLGKQPAYVLEFQGKRNDEYYEGECLIVEYRGIGYWFFTFALQTDLKDKAPLEKAWQELRDSFVLADKREDWNPQERPTKSYKGKGYSVSYPIDVWIKPGEKSKDPACDLALFGEDPRPRTSEDAESRDARAGHLHVVVLGKPDDNDLGKLLRDHFLAQQAAAGLGKRDDMQLKVLEDRQKKPLESDRDFGAVKGHVIKYKLSVTGMPARFVVLAHIPLDEQTIGIYADSSFNLRDFWEQEINAVLEGFTVGK